MKNNRLYMELLPIGVRRSPYQQSLRVTKLERAKEIVKEKAWLVLAAIFKDKDGVEHTILEKPIKAERKTDLSFMAKEEEVTEALKRQGLIE